MSPARYGPSTTADDVLADLDLSGRVMLVTGANTGIGFETARALAGRGAEVHVGCRSAEKAAAACEALRGAQPEVRVVPLALDLSARASVEAGAAAFAPPRLDALICNAGLYGGGYGETAEGIERTVGVCHFGHALLTRLLLERVLAAEDGRVVVVASNSHRSPPRLDFDRFPLRRERYSDLVAYGQAKLCNVLFAAELDRRYGARGLTSSSLHPGSLIPTSIDRGSLLARLAMLLARPFSKTLGQGAATSVYCAARPELRGRGGRYYTDCAEAVASPEARDPEVARRLWDLTAERLALDWP